MPSPVSLATVFDMATTVPLKFITMNSVVTERYGRILNTGLYFYQSEGKMSINLIKEAMGIQYFKVKLVVIISKYEALVDYQPRETRVSDYYLATFSGNYPVQSGVVSVECFRIDDKLPFFTLQDFAFVCVTGISFMGLVSTDQVIKNPQFQSNWGSYDFLHWFLKFIVDSLV